MNMENIICIDLKMFNHIKLKELCDIHGFNYDTLLNNKYEGFAKLWIRKEDNMIVAFTTKKSDTVQYTDMFSNDLLKINPISLQKQPKNLDLDSILEKISAYGIDSLKPDEKDFLNNLK